MRRLRRVLALAVIVGACVAPLVARAETQAVWLRGGAVWTGDPAHPSAESVLVDGERIAAIGTDREVGAIAARYKPAPRVIELKGRRVLPGLIDSHIHIVGGGLQLTRVDLNPARSRKETLELITKYAAEHPKSPWILGRGWSYDLWKPGLPTRGELDAVLRDRPVFVRAYDGHSGWANSRALELAGITDKTPDPKDGKIVREPGSMRPSGALLEGAMDLMWDRIPKPTVDEKRVAIQRATEHAAAHGVTTMCEVGGDLVDLDVYEALDREGKLAARVVFGPSIDDGIEAYGKRRERFLGEGKHRLLTPGPLKGFVDGVVESGTATMLQPFSDGGKIEPAHISPQQLVDQIGRADALKLDVSYHAIGDGAVRSVLDAVEAVKKRNPAWDRRPRIEHIEVVAKADVPRFAAIGVIPSMMPLHADPGIEPDGGVWVKKVGPERLQRAFAFADLRRAGAALAFGSDWPVVSLDPLPAIAMAVTRTREDGLPKGGWVPQQALGMDEALHGYTTRAAYATRLEQTTGMLKKGLAADLVVLDASARLERPESLFHAHVELTMVAGRIVHETK